MMLQPVYSSARTCSCRAFWTIDAAGFTIGDDDERYCVRFERVPVGWYWAIVFTLEVESVLTAGWCPCLVAGIFVRSWAIGIGLSATVSRSGAV